jgi:molybdopterin-guanine dinucleotide biosynthesis protein MobB
MTHGPLVISVVGTSGVGKTTLVERLVPELRARGLRVGTVKHASHGFIADRTGSDSWRHQQAGADSTLLVGPEGAAVFLAAHVAHPDGGDDARSNIARMVAAHLHFVDVVLAEGYAPIHDLLIEVDREGVPRKEPAGPRTVWLTVTDRPEGNDRPDGNDRLGFEQIDLVAERIVARLAQ